jgi:acetoacetyl-CoA reductase
MIEGRVALITGGLGGLGRTICENFLHNGARVVAAYYRGDQAKVQEWLSYIKSKGYKIIDVHVDVRSFTSCKKMIAEVREKVGTVDILINNAGITADSTLKKMTVNQWRSVLRTNLDSVFNVTRNVINDMIKNEFGRIVNISSINALKGQFGQTNYASAKAGMHGFTKSLAQEVMKHGITVNTVSPGYFESQMTRKVPEDVMKKIIMQIPAGRLGTPEEVARVISFLVSEESGYITGANISINGGQYMA